MPRDVARILSLGGLKPMVSAECEPIMGVWGQSPSGIQGQSPWWGSGGQSPPEVGMLNGNRKTGNRF